MFDWLFKRKISSLEPKRLNIRKKLVLLLILDGLGIHPDQNGNAVLNSKTPFLDTVWSKGYSTLLHASGIHVGLPDNEPGNSEVGHLSIGSGQIVYQSLTRINDDIRNDTLKSNPELLKGIEKARSRGSNFHIMGILSDGGVHGHINHLFALLDICKAHQISPFIHVITDGRDTPLDSAPDYLKQLQDRLDQIQIGKIASVSGRLYAMDRDKRWERTQLAFNAIIGEGKRTATDPIQLLQTAYGNDENDQILLPTTIVDSKGKPVGAVEDGDVVLFYNFREDRARQLTKAFVLDEPGTIKKSVPFEKLYFITMTGYEDNLPTHIIFPPKKIVDSLSTALLQEGKKQFHIAETEKYMHVTYFFNGGYEQPREGEDFFNVPSPKVFDYSQTPEMSAQIVRDEVIYRLQHNKKSFNYSFIVCNLSNPDMLGHTGNLPAAIEAVQFVDKVARDIVTETVKADGAAILIADHGNCETMIDRVTGKPDTYHTSNPVPFILVDQLSQCVPSEKDDLPRVGLGRTAPVTGTLSDIAPTVLSILGVKVPDAMTGINLMDVLTPKE